MAAFLGGLQITSMRWNGLHALGVNFLSVYTDRYVQIYSGRKLVGVTSSLSATRVVGQVDPSRCPPPITLLAVAVADRLTDFGPQLPRRPWNQYRLAWSAVDYPDDAKWFDITGSQAAGESADPTNLLAQVEFIGDADYTFELPPLESGGAWEYVVTPRDDSLPDGNAGTPDSVSITARVYPPDVALRSDGKRFLVSIADGVLTASFSYQE